MICLVKFFWYVYYIYILESKMKQENRDRINQILRFCFWGEKGRGGKYFLFWKIDMVISLFIVYFVIYNCFGFVYYYYYLFIFRDMLLVYDVLYVY